VELYQGRIDSCGVLQNQPASKSTFVWGIEQKMMISPNLKACQIRIELPLKIGKDIYRLSSLGKI